MPVSTTWVSPVAGGTLDLTTGAILTETWTDAVVSNFLHLASTDGAILDYAFGPGVSVAPTTTSTTLVDMVDPIFTFTTAVIGTVFLLAHCTMSHSAGGVVFLATNLDNSDSPETQNTLASGANTSSVSSVVIWRYTGVAAGSHTAKMRWRTNTGTARAENVSRTLLAMHFRNS